MSVFFALIAGIGVSSEWRDWILFTNRANFGIKDPQFHKDIGFYVFQLPFLQFIAGLARSPALLVVLIVTAVVPLPQRRHPAADPVPARDAAGEGRTSR